MFQVKQFRNVSIKKRAKASLRNETSQTYPGDALHGKAAMSQTVGHAGSAPPGHAWTESKALTWRTVVRTFHWETHMAQLRCRGREVWAILRRACALETQAWHERWGGGWTNSRGAGPRGALGMGGVGHAVKLSLEGQTRDAKSDPTTNHNQPVPTPSRESAGPDRGRSPTGNSVAFRHSSNWPLLGISGPLSCSHAIPLCTRAHCPFAGTHQTTRGKSWRVDF